MFVLKCSLLNREQTLLNFLKTLASISSIFPCSLGIKDPTELIYVLNEVNVPSFQCKM